MKIFFYTIIGLLLSVSIYAQAPQSFKYQAVARDASGEVIANQAVGMQISILQGSTSGTALYVETFTPTTNEFGLINLNIGAGTVVSGNFTTIDWSTNIHFVKIEMDITSGTTYKEFGTSQLLSVPYAMHAKTAANTFSGNYNDLNGAPVNVSTFTNDAGYLTSFTETDPIFVAHAANGITSTNITNWTTAYGWGNHSTVGYTTTDTTLNETEVDNFVANNGYLTIYTETDPVFTEWDKSYNDLTNKPNIIDSINTVIDTTTQFVRTEVDGDITNEIQDLSLSSNTLSLTNDATTVDLSQYLDNTDNQNLANVLTQGSDAGNNFITNLSDPVNDQDAATKAYVDALEDRIFDLEYNAGKDSIADYDGN